MALFHRVRLMPDTQKKQYHYTLNTVISTEETKKKGDTFLSASPSLFEQTYSYCISIASLIPKIK